MNDPFAMRPFFGYNFGHYLQHWLDMEKKSDVKLPSVFHVNWFRKSPEGKFLWPGFGENCRVLDWILRRIDGEDVAVDSPIGYLPKPESMNLNGLDQQVDMQQLFHLPKDFWAKEVSDLKIYLDSQVGDDLPKVIVDELTKLEENINKM